jgi:hypothetical protein
MSEHVLTSLPRFRKGMLACVFVTAWLPLSSLAQTSSRTSPWSNSALSPGERATLVLKEMTLDEKISQKGFQILRTQPTGVCRWFPHKTMGGPISRSFFARYGIPPMLTAKCIG